MKKVWLLFLFVHLFAHFGVGQSVIENPGKPLSKNPGRILRLKEVMRIIDEGKAFYFKLPWGLGVAGNGSVFVQDGIRFFKFDPNGEFVKNILREGQGPGEITTELTNFGVSEDEILLLCGPMSKIVRLDFDGKLIGEIIVEECRPDRVVGFFDNRCLVFDFKVISFDRKEGERPLDHTLFYCDEKGSCESIPGSFPTKSYVRIRKLGGRTAVSGTPMTQLEFVGVQDRFLYISHTHEYLIKQFDLESNQISKMFRRDFPRSKFEADDYRPFKYYNDVHRLVAHQNDVWVLTSAFDSEKGILVDFFDEEGKYRDNFYLPLLNSKTGTAIISCIFRS